MKSSRTIPMLLLAGAVGLAACADDGSTPVGPSPRLGPSGIDGAAQGAAVQINVGLSRPATDAIRAELSSFGQIWGEIPEIDAIMLSGARTDIATIEALRYVAWAEEDSEVTDGQPDAVLAEDFTDGLSMWNLDAVDVTQPGFDNRQVAQTGAGVYVGVLDSGLLRTWRLYFPEERIAEEHARAFRGGPLEVSAQPEVPNMWERDVSSHGTHVTSTIIGFDFFGTGITGVAPEATIIPVKVLNQNGSGWASVTAQGIVYIASLKAGPLSGSPVVINMSLGGSSPSQIQKAAIDFAIAQGVVIVASAGNRGNAGMGYPGAFEEVVSAGSVGWGDCDLSTPPLTLNDCFGQWVTGNWWFAGDVDEDDVGDFYVSGFSSREKPGQDLDVLAPGHWVVGPFQVDRRGSQSYFFLSGTSMASPHVAGIVALMLEKDPSLTASQVEAILEGAATPMPAPDTHFPLAAGPACCFQFSWDSDATGHGFITADAALAAIP